MFDDKQKLEISQVELALIEAALHTQSKILSVQASAGGSKALGHLNEVKRVLASISQQRVRDTTAKPAWGGLFRMARLLG